MAKATSSAADFEKSRAPCPANPSPRATWTPAPATYLTVNCTTWEAAKRRQSTMQVKFESTEEKRELAGYGTSTLVGLSFRRWSLALHRARTGGIPLSAWYSKSSPPEQPLNCIGSRFCVVLHHDYLAAVTPWPSRLHDPFRAPGLFVIRFFCRLLFCLSSQFNVHAPT